MAANPCAVERAVAITDEPYLNLVCRTRIMLDATLRLVSLILRQPQECTAKLKVRPLVRVENMYKAEEMV